MAKTKTNQATSGNRTLKNIPVKKFIDDYIYRIDLDAEYQREKIWTTNEQEKLLDSIVIDIDIPKIYLVKVGEKEQFDFECIDGKQRMTTLLRFFRPESDEISPLKLPFLLEKFTYARLQEEHPTIAKKIEDFELSFTIYESMEDEFVRDIFRRLQLGIRLNSGEMLKSRTGTIRDFIFTTIGNDGPFFRNSNLSAKRFSRPFTLAQMCINSFSNVETGDYTRARLQDIEDFFEENHDLNENDDNLNRIKEVLELMDTHFGENAMSISSRSVAVTAFLFIEEMAADGHNNRIPAFAVFFVHLLSEIKHNMALLSQYEKPQNTIIMEEFQKYIMQASVESYSIKRRQDFLKKAFAYYQNPKTKGKIIGS